MSLPAGAPGPPTLVALGLVLLVPSAAAAVSNAFDGLYGQDPYAYYDYAVGPLRASLGRLELPPPFYWPPGYPVLVALATMVAGVSSTTGQLVSLLAGALVPVFTALLAAEVFRDVAVEPGRSPGPGTSRAQSLPGGEPSDARSRDDRALRAWLVPAGAGLIVALSGQLRQSSIVVMADTTGLACASFGAWALSRYGRTGHWRWLVAAAVGLAWAIATRWVYALVALPLAVYALVVLARRDRPSALVHLGVATLVGGALLAPVLVPAAVSLVGQVDRYATFAVDLQVYSWSPLNALRRSFVTADGRLSYLLPNGIFYALLPAQPYYLSPALAVLAPLGLLAVARRRSIASLWLVVGWAAIVYAFHAGAPWQNVRFGLAYLPPVAVLVAFGADWLYRRPARLPNVTVALLLAAGLGWQIVGGGAPTAAILARKRADLTTAHPVEAQLPPEARLLAFGPTLSLQHYTRLDTTDLFDLGPAALAALIADGRPTYLLIDVENVTNQWRDRAPANHYLWLDANVGLVAIGRHAEYTLYRVGAPRS